MLNTNNNYLDQAAEYWRQNQPLKAGRLIFENLPREARSLWASNILKSVVERTGIESSSIKNILQIANHPSEGNKAHEAFSLARAETLKLNRFQEKTIEQMLLVQQMGLAELVAKVIYNCTDPQDEFDRDSGWWIAVCLKNILNLLQDEEFSKLMWLLLCWQGKC